MTNEQFGVLNAKMDQVLGYLKPSPTPNDIFGFANTGKPQKPVIVSDPEPGVTEWFREMFEHTGAMLSLTADTTLETIVDEATDQTVLMMVCPHLVSKEGSEYSGYAIIGRYADLREIEDPYHEIDWYLQEMFGPRWKDDFKPEFTRKMRYRSGVLAHKGWGCRANIRQRAANAPTKP